MQIGSICFTTKLKNQPENGNRTSREVSKKKTKSIVQPPSSSSNNVNSNTNNRDTSNNRKRIVHKIKSPHNQNVDIVLQKHHQRIKNKTNKPDLNKLNNTTLLSFDEKIRGDSVLKSPGKKPRVNDKLAFIYKTNDPSRFDLAGSQRTGPFASSVRKVKAPSLSVTKKGGPNNTGRYHSIVAKHAPNRGAFSGEGNLISSTIVNPRHHNDQNGDRRIPLKHRGRRGGKDKPAPGANGKVNGSNKANPMARQAMQRHRNRMMGKREEEKEKSANKKFTSQEMSKRKSNAPSGVHNDPQAANPPSSTTKTYSQLKVHRGPINMNAITMKEPEQVIQQLMNILQSISVRFKQSNNFSLKCEIKELRFLIEINLVEKFSNIFVIKFYKNNQSPKYFDLCSQIFAQLAL